MDLLYTFCVFCKTAFQDSTDKVLKCMRMSFLHILSELVLKENENDTVFVLFCCTYLVNKYLTVPSCELPMHVIPLCVFWNMVILNALSCATNIFPNFLSFHLV